MKVGT